jgi:hypothetical protein
MGLESPCGVQEPKASVHADVGLFRSAAAIASDLMAPGPRKYSRPLDDGWVAFLKDYEWQWFATLTFEDAVHPEAASKRYVYWTRLLDEAYGVPKKKRADHPRRVRWARGLEWQKRDVLHFHAVIGNIPTESDTRAERGYWQEKWFELGRTGIARIWPVESAEGVVQYIAKYCSKGGEVDLSAGLALVQSNLRDSVA